LATHQNTFTGIDTRLKQLYIILNKLQKINAKSQKTLLCAYFTQKFYNFTLLSGENPLWIVE